MKVLCILHLAVASLVAATVATRACAQEHPGLATVLAACDGAAADDHQGAEHEALPADPVVEAKTVRDAARLRTRIAVRNKTWEINGLPTYPGAAAEGLLMNVRMVNAVFEDAHDATRPVGFEADANVEAFLHRIPEYLSHGVRAFTVCLQGGFCGYEGALNSAFRPDGSLRDEYLQRVERVIEACDRHGAVVILGCFYQRQDQLLKDEDAVRAGVGHVAEWLRQRGYQNVLLEIANEFGHGGFNHPILKSAWGQVELIRVAKEINPTLMVSASGLGDGRLPPELAQAADFLLVHFNGTSIEDMPARIKQLQQYELPIVCNEDQKYGADGAAAARVCVRLGVSWGFMEDRVNQYYPFQFQGAADDVQVYAALKELTSTSAAAPRLRVMVETDAGGDPDDEQSLVRFLLYANEWDVEGIICNRPSAREGENHNVQRTGLGIAQQVLGAYADCYAHLIQHDARYPSPDELLERTVAGYGDREDGVDLIVSAIDNDDPRPLWFMNWGTDRGSSPSNLKRALDQVLAERGAAGYAAFKRRVRLSSDDQFGDHTARIEPHFPLWIDTFRPAVAGKRWYHRFSALTATAGGFDLQRDVLNGHGPLGQLYPTNTTHPQKEGDSMTFLYLVPTGMNDAEEPTWGSWAGRYGRRPDYAGKPYFWASQEDAWQGTRSRDNTLSRWASDLQNDFRARLDWCVEGFADANHPPIPKLTGPARATVVSGERVALDASNSTDPDGDRVRIEWIYYPEPGSYRGPAIELSPTGPGRISFSAPQVQTDVTLHLIVAVTDEGTPSLARYARVILTVEPRATGPSTIR